jgi:hypothetical protein
MIQHYALATFYYSTNGDKWNNKSGWSSDADECKWYDGKTFYGVGGSFCHYGKVVQLVMVEADGVTMTSNNLDGTIPNEIALLSNSLGKLLAFFIF